MNGNSRRAQAKGANSDAMRTGSLKGGNPQAVGNRLRRRGDEQTVLKRAGPLLKNASGEIPSLSAGEHWQPVTRRSLETPSLTMSYSNILKCGRQQNFWALQQNLWVSFLTGLVATEIEEDDVVSVP